MSDTKHTPGPWRWNARLNQAYDIMGEVAVCRLYVDRTVNGCAYRDGEPEANARLIAATPDLLAALEAGVGFYPVPSLMRDAALAAIAKARGKP